MGKNIKASCQPIPIARISGDTTKLHKNPKGSIVFSHPPWSSLFSHYTLLKTTFISSSSTTFNTTLLSTTHEKTHHHEPPKSTTITTTTMKISSKSILSPARAGSRDPPSSLSTSLSRRLKNSGSIKGGASPAMFPTTAKKRGSFENPEPSSPKVTCIGQVRVKTKKKQAKKLRTLSRRHTAGGEVSFRQQHTHHQESWPPPPPPPPPEKTNPKWVHFPVTICDALRAFGSEFSCLFPCRKEEKPAAADDVSNNHRHGSCGAVFARWMVAVQDGGGEERDIELVVEKEEVEEEEEESFKKPRRHVFEDLEIINDGIEGESRVSICIPPKNALLLMRCRSDPMKMEALTTARSWEPTIGRNDEEDEEIVEEKIVDLKECEGDLKMGKKEIIGLDQNLENVLENGVFQDHDNVLKDEVLQDNVQENEVFQDSVQEDEVFQDQDQDHENLQENEAFLDQEHENVQQDEGFQDQEHYFEQQDEVFLDQEHYHEQQDEVFQDSVQQDEVLQDQEHENEQQDEVFQEQEQTEEESMYLGFLFEEIMNQDDEIQENEVDSQMVKAHEEHEEIYQEKVVSTMATEFAEISKTHKEKILNNGVLERESEVKDEREVLPDCLLMMMYEPKLSMEVSKETWVCSQDFIKRQSNKRKPPPPPPAVKHDGGDRASVSVANATTTTDYDLMRVADGGYAAAVQHPAPARSSCSFPAPPSMATVLGQKLADAMGYEPFVLTRCKSEPMKTAAAKLLPESCVWENRKSKRLSGVAFGVGAAGLGF